MYRSYRGPRGHTGCLIPILTVLCIFAALVLLFLYNNLAFTPEGTVLTLPFSGREILIGAREPEPEPNLIIEQNTNVPETPAEQVSETAEDTSNRDEFETRTEKSIFIPLEVLSDKTAFDELYSKLDKTRTDTVVLEVKAETGRLAFTSASKLAVKAGAGSADNTNLKNTLTKLIMDGYNVSAMVSCFRDDLAARKSQANAARTKNKVIWLDRGNITWLNPYNEGACDYILELIDEVYALGFKEILLTNVCFPYYGKTNLLYYPDEEEGTDKQTAISGFISRVIGKSKEKQDLRVSIKHEFAPTNEDPAPGGQAFSDLIANFYRIYAEIPRLEAGRGIDTNLIEEYFKAIGETDFSSRFVPILETTESDEPADVFDLIYTARTKGNGYLLFNENGKYPKGVLSSETD